ncbi:hypothetical protein GN956_G4058 [Arapaima gigas]
MFGAVKDKKDSDLPSQENHQSLPEGDFCDGCSLNSWPITLTAPNWNKMPPEVQLLQQEPQQKHPRHCNLPQLEVFSSKEQPKAVLWSVVTPVAGAPPTAGPQWASPCATPAKTGP